MGPNVRRDDANVVMEKVLGHLHSVVEHLRNKDETEAANEIAINTVSIVKAFNNATAPWDMEKFYMSPRLQDPNRANGHDHPGAVVGHSWASVAAKEVNGHNRWIKYRPSDGVKGNVSNDRICENAPLDLDLRVVWITGWGRDRSLAQVTQLLSQGPIYSMVYSSENDAVCVIFQHASSAQALLSDEDYNRAEKGVSIFGAGCSLIPGLPYHEDDNIRRMDNPVNERRRLTFARSQLFAHGMTEEQFKKDIYAEVGEQNVELVWLFNTGNATVVFTSTAIARRVRDRFRQEAKRNGPYRDVHVSFSHDPCEKPMNLITQMPIDGPAMSRRSSNASAAIPGFSRSNSVKGTASSSTLGLTRSPSKHNKKVDADGWQTVGKRR